MDIGVNGPGQGYARRFPAKWIRGRQQRFFSALIVQNNRSNAQTTKQFAMDLAQVSIVPRKIHSIGIRSFQKMPLSLKETFLVLHETVGRRRNIKVQEFAAAGGTATHTEPRRALLPTCRGGYRN